MKRHIALLALITVSSSAWSQGTTIRLDPLADAAVGIGGLCAAVCSELLLDGNASAAPIVDPARYVPFDSGLDTASAVVQYAAMLSPAAIALVIRRSELVPSAIAYAEAMLWIFAAKNAIKALVVSERPYAYGPGALSEELLEEAYESFPSGHTALAFCAATSLAVMCLELAPDSLASPWLIGAGYALAVGEGALRVMSGNHFLVDVAAGAALGSGIGWAIMAAHMADDGDRPVSLSPYGTGIAMTMRL